ncbi:MAG: hypothetical protein IAA81_07815 [Spirochaetes bacterium]|uniref:Uncharacterized protein n=1 Tax=Candidatus Gallitreponema excrementavium TaxID=2840840 RepID=A0A9D9N2V5_9SPIR|nr:hypothetical protein [Candidatus Gallitreponema excrementavium]
MVNEPSLAAQVIVAVIPIVGIVMGSVVVFFYLLWRHREISLQIRTGIYKPSKFNFKIFSLLAGLLLFFLGIVMTVLFWVVSGVNFELLGGLIPLALGMGLLGFYILTRKSDI